MAGDRAQIGGQGQMRAPLHLGDNRSHLRFVEINYGDPGSRRGEGERHFAADAAGPTGDEDAFAVEPGG